MSFFQLGTANLRSGRARRPGGERNPVEARRGRNFPSSRTGRLGRQQNPTVHRHHAYDPLSACRRVIKFFQLHWPLPDGCHARYQFEIMLAIGLMTETKVTFCDCLKNEAFCELAKSGMVAALQRGLSPPLRREEPIFFLK